MVDQMYLFNTASILPPPDTPAAGFIATLIVEEVINYLTDFKVTNSSEIISHLKYVHKVFSQIMKEGESLISCTNDTLALSGGIPEEAKLWLDSTFTKQSTVMQNRKKVSLKSVITTLIAGFHMKRICRRDVKSQLFVIPVELRKFMQNMPLWEFDIFAFDRITNEMPLKFIGYEVLRRHGLLHRFSIPFDKLEVMLKHLEHGYQSNKNAYHNNLHACDVLLTMNYFMEKLKLRSFMSDVEIFAGLIAALIHDYDHTGTTNNFLINSRTALSVLYNDKSVLENYHVSAFFRMMEEYDCDIFTSMEHSEFRYFRTLLIELVLNTDMTLHHSHLRNIRKLLLLNSTDLYAQNNRILCFLLHCSDISHPAKDWRLHYEWTNRCMEEFFIQGDKESELNLEISPLCKRNETNIPLSQIAFIECVIEPTFIVLENLFCKIKGPYTDFLSSYNMQNSYWHSSFHEKHFNRPWRGMLHINKIMWRTLLGANYGLK